MLKTKSIKIEKYWFILFGFFFISMYHNIQYKSVVVNSWPKLGYQIPFFFIHSESTTNRIIKINISESVTKSEKYILDLTTSRPKPKPTNSQNKTMKYILQWTDSDSESYIFLYMGVGQTRFIENKCAYTNCYVTSNRTFLPNITEFDVVAFDGSEVRSYRVDKLPKARSPHQKYVFASTESSYYYPVCWDGFDGYFNWTWTFKLDSDSRWGYLVVRNKSDVVVGPNKIMHWIRQEDMEPVTEELKTFLLGKSKTAAWFASNCLSASGREKYVKRLQDVLQSKYNTKIDIYGKCGKLRCSRRNENKCDEMLRRDYYFYLSFENAFSEDYVTEKLVRPLKFNVIPIVYGGANYSRFLPENSYINANKLKPEEVADKMYILMSNLDEYADYFRWTNHYYYQRRGESAETDDYCGMCELLNNESKVRKTEVYNDFKHWWTQPYTCIVDVRKEDITKEDINTYYYNQF